MIDVVKEPHTSIFSGPTGCGKTERVLHLLENEYRQHFENIIILCSSLRWNKTYLERSWIWKEDFIFCIEPGDNLSNLISGLSSRFAGETSLFIIDDMISSDLLDKRRSSLIELACSGRHKKHSMWILTQSYCAIPTTVRRQTKQLFIWYPKARHDMRFIHEENEVLTDAELTSAKNTLKNSKHACLFLKIEHPRAWSIIND